MYVYVFRRASKNPKLLCKGEIDCASLSAESKANQLRGNPLLNHGNRVLGIVDIFTGGLTQCTVDRRLIFAIALKATATRIIFVHYAKSLFM